MRFDWARQLLRKPPPAPSPYAEWVRLHDTLDDAKRAEIRHAIESFRNKPLVSVVVPLRALSAEDFIPELKKMLGPFGEAVALKQANKLLVQDTAGNLRRVWKLVKETDRPKAK